MAVWCRGDVGELCRGVEGVGCHGGLRARSWTDGVHGVAAECDGSLALLQGTSGGVDVSERLRGDRSESAASSASWGAVVVKNGSASTHGLDTATSQSCSGTARQGVRQWSPLALTSAVRGEGMREAERGQCGVFSSTSQRRPARRSAEQHGGVRSSTGTSLWPKLLAFSMLWWLSEVRERDGREESKNSPLNPSI